jgi:hypothetical protein
MKTCAHLWCHWTLIKMRNISNKIWENQNIFDGMFNPPPKSWHSWGNVEYYVKSHTGHRGQIVWCCSEKIKFACRITKAKIHTLIISNIHCFPTITMFTGRLFDLTFYIHCLFCSFFLNVGFQEPVPLLDIVLQECNTSPYMCEIYHFDNIPSYPPPTAVTVQKPTCRLLMFWTN